MKPFNALTSPPVLALFDPDLPVVLQMDASHLNGIGYALLQDHGNGHLHLVQCGSRFLADAETRYATTELEMLAVVWHLQEKISPYIFTAKWRSGKLLCVPDALSRAPVSYPTQEDKISGASAAHLRTVIAMNTVTLSDESSAQDADRILQDLRDDFLATDMTCTIPYSHIGNIRADLYADGDLVLYGARVVVPTALRHRTLSHLHDSHRGVEATKRRARQSVFWSGIDSDIANTVGACEACQTLQPSQQQEPLLNDDNPTRPFESVSADFFVVAGKFFLVVVDHLSGWPVVTPCKGDTTASNTIRIFCRYFREVGVPLRLRTDGEPQFTSAEFKDFIRHMVTSPHYPQSNAPSGNIDNEDFDRGLLELGNTPNFTGRSPAQIPYDPPLRSCIPAHPKASSKEWQVKTEDCDRHAADRYEQVKTQYDQHAHSLPKLSVGQQVRIQDPTSHRWDKVGIVMGHGKSRDYQIRLPSGRVWWRNRRFLRPVPPTISDPFLPVPVAPCPDLDRESLVTIPPVNPSRSQRLIEKESARECTTSHYTISLDPKAGFSVSLPYTTSKQCGILRRRQMSCIIGSSTTAMFFYTCSDILEGVLGCKLMKLQVVPGELKNPLTLLLAYQQPVLWIMQLYDLASHIFFRSHEAITPPCL
ncbi:uncharacterized protein [Palaemon carinicauda]|uniref:uncharacterized protein n=1 Tax=Palaemon carinicauda TaxID=392227 RepID=UPI0035B5E490